MAKPAGWLLSPRVPRSLRTRRMPITQPLSPSAVVPSHDLWVQRFGSDADSNVAVIGVLPPEFEPLLKATSEIPPQMYYPLQMRSRPVSQYCESVRRVGRPRPG